MDARYWPLALVGSSLAFAGYLPEMWRVCCHSGAQPASQLLWAVWLISALCNLAYAYCVLAEALVLANYFVNAGMCLAAFLCNLRLVCRR